MPLYKNLPPNPLSLVESMRDIGYSMETAVADIIDNSITAKAKNINLRFDWNSNHPWLAVIDDGKGMNGKELYEAMRFGSISPLEKRNENDLGRFGLGLKTASFSQGRSLTVFTKQQNDINCCQWNLDHLHQHDKSEWSLCVFSNEEISELSTINELYNDFLLTSDTGTIVLIENIDRVGERRSENSRELIFNETLGDVRSHLELVFHRYISPEPGKKKINFFFNKSPLIAFDPFYESKSSELRSEEFQYEGERIKVQPYILPHHSKVSKSDWKKYSGKLGYLNHQGFYVYRNRRLIISSTWFRLIPKIELTKLLRVKVDIPNSLDHLWRIDVKKSNAFPPAGVRESLKNIIGKIELSGKNVYRQRGQKLIEDIKSPAWERVARDNQIFYEINKEHPLIVEIMNRLNSQDQDLFIAIISMLESSFPREFYFHDVASSPEEVIKKELSHEQLTAMLSLFINDLQPDVSQTRLREILQIDPFASNIILTKQIFEERGYEY